MLCPQIIYIHDKTPFIHLENAFSKHEIILRDGKYRSDFFTVLLEVILFRIVGYKTTFFMYKRILNIFFTMIIFLFIVLSFVMVILYRLSRFWINTQYKRLWVFASRKEYNYSSLCPFSNWQSKPKANMVKLFDKDISFTLLKLPVEIFR